MKRLCELGSAIDSSPEGFVLRFHGFDSKLIELFQVSFQVFLDFCGRTGKLPESVSQDRFEAFLEMLRPTPTL
jgi:hypothetical protein